VCSYDDEVESEESETDESENEVSLDYDYDPVFDPDRDEAANFVVPKRRSARIRAIEEEKTNTPENVSVSPVILLVLFLILEHYYI